METLEKLFGSATKVKIMRLFLFNPSAIYDMADVTKKTKSKQTAVRKELNSLLGASVIKKKNFIKEISKKKGKKITISKKKCTGYFLNTKFSYLPALQSVLIHTTPLSDNEVTRRFGSTGSIKLLIISGLFIQEWESRLDILIVGNNIKQNQIDSAIKLMESEVGREIKYAAFETDDFEYRLGMFDKLIRDVLDYPHRKLVDKLNLEPVNS